MDSVTTILILLSVLLYLYYFLWRRMNYFQRLGIPHESAIPILGHMAPIVFRRVFMGEYLQRMYNHFSHAKYFGFYSFTTPVIVLRDPDLITSITIKNFDNFTDHYSFANEDMDAFMGKNLFSLRGDAWKEMRKLLSPTFTASKMKIMFNLITDCADNFTEHIATQSKQGKVFNVKDIMGRYTNDVIATTSFGIAVDSMKNPNNEFYLFAKRAANFTFGQGLKMLINRHFPDLSKLFGVTVTSEETRRYFTNIISETVRMRKEKGIYRPDMIQLMMESKDTHGRELTMEEMTNQAFTFFIAGYDASSTVLSFVIHEIAVNPHVQTKLRAEIEDVARKTNGKPTYEAIKDMMYMDAVVNETNRLYPVTTSLERVCVKEFELLPATPDSNPVIMKPGDGVWFSALSLHRDPKYYPEPLRFDPDRFLNGEVSPNVYIPFGLGPRICIGNRFALMEIKIALFYLLLRCDLEPCAQTTLPMRFSTKSLIMTPVNGFWLNFKTRKDRSVSCTNG